MGDDRHGRGDVTDAQRTQYRRERWWLASTVVSLCCLVAVVLIANSGVNADELREVQQRQSDATLCLLEELNAHRVNSYAADRNDSLRHGAEHTVPAPLPLELPREKLAAACERVLDTVTADSNPR